MYGEKIHLNIKPFKCTMFMTIDVILEKKKIDLRFIIALPCVATTLKNIRHKFQFNNSMEALTLYYINSKIGAFKGTAFYNIFRLDR